MRFTPAAIALSLLATVTSSVGFTAPTRTFDPRAAALLAEGRAALAAGNVDKAVDALEAALAIEPGSPAVYLVLGDATRRQGMQGKALHYYRLALQTEPGNLLAIFGEGAALAEKGAMEKARRNLTRLEGLCGKSCDATRTLAEAIARGPATRVLTAQAVTPDPVVTEN